MLIKTRSKWTALIKVVFIKPSKNCHKCYECFIIIEQLILLRTLRERKWALMIKILFLLCVVLTGQLAEAGYLIEQKVTTQLGSKVKNSKYSWKIGQKGFRLDIKSTSGFVSYIFNGRNFYACCQLDIGKYLEAKSVHDDLVSKMKKGSCQAVPLNFMARFFLSPSVAISSLDYTDGMQVSLAMANYSFKRTDSYKKVLNQKCLVAKRNFSVNKKNKLKGEDDFHHVDETLCVANSLTGWRYIMWKQLSRDLMRQPAARGLLSGLKVDYKKLKGVVLSGSASFAKTDEKGLVKKGKRSIKTTKILEKNYTKKISQIPSNYIVIDLQSMMLSDYSEKRKEYDKKKDPLPAILYYVLGGFL